MLTKKPVCAEGPRIGNLLGVLALPLTDAIRDGAERVTALSAMH